MTKPQPARSASRDDEAARPLTPRWAQDAWRGEGEKLPASAPLSLPAIVKTAVQLADEAGLAELSIRRIASRLSVSPMALYRYVDSRDDLLLLMAEQATGAPPAPANDAASWQDGVRAWAVAMFDRYSAHPWIVDVPLGGVPATPHRALWLEQLLQLLDRTGLDLQTTLDAALLIDTHLRGTVHLARDLSSSSEGPRSPSHWLSEFLLPERFPALSRVVAVGAFDDGTEPSEQFGLERIIAGLEAIVPTSRK